MKKYYISASVTVSCYTEVEAESKEEALEIAEDRDMAGLCYRPFTSSIDENWHIDTDGSPSKLTVDSEEDVE